MKNKESLTGFGIFVFVIAVCGGLLYGYHTAVISGALGFLSSVYGLSPYNEGMIVSILLLGGLTGALFAGFLADRLGRKYTMILMVGFLIVGGLIIIFASSYSRVLLGRMVSGLGLGLASVVCPLYLAEVVPANYRGRCVSAFQLTIACGVLLAFTMTVFFADENRWRFLFIVGAFISLVELVFLLFIPETPSWSITHSKRPEAIKALKELRSDMLWESDLDRMAKVTKEKKEWKVFLQPNIRVVLAIGFFLSMFQQITGINAVIYYAPKIFQTIGNVTNAGSFQSTLSIGAINLLSTLVAVFILDKVGRRQLLLIGTLGMVITLSVLSFGFYIQTGFIDLLAFWSLMGYVACFAFSLGPVTWVILSEIFPLKIRGNAIALALALNWFSNYAISLTFPDLIHHFGGAVCFALFAVISLAAFVFIYRYIPETKGKTLEEIEAMVHAGKL